MLISQVCACWSAAATSESRTAETAGVSQLLDVGLQRLGMLILYALFILTAARIRSTGA